MSLYLALKCIATEVVLAIYRRARVNRQVRIVRSPSTVSNLMRTSFLRSARRLGEMISVLDSDRLLNIDRSNTGSDRRLETSISLCWLFPEEDARKVMVTSCWPLGCMRRQKRTTCIRDTIMPFKRISTVSKAPSRARSRTIDRNFSQMLKFLNWYFGSTW